MKRIFLSLLLGLGAFAQTASATITVNVDSSSELRGSFSFTGNIFPGESYAPISFRGFLPGSSAFQFLSGFRAFNAPTGDLDVFFGTPSASTNPTPMVGFPGDFSKSGAYNDDQNGAWVEFVLTSSDTGGANGTYSGAFDFTVRASQPGPVGVPEGGSSAGLLSAAMIGIIVVRKRLGRP